MLGIGVFGDETAQVADALYPGLGRRSGEVGRGPQVQLTEVAACAHGVDQVVRDADPFQDGGQRRRLQGVRCHDLHPLPAPCLQNPGLAAGDAHRHLRRQEPGDQMGADVAAGPEDEAGAGLGAAGHGAGQSQNRAASIAPECTAPVRHSGSLRDSDSS